MKKIKIFFLLVIFFTLINGLFAQTEFPAGDFWALDAGFGMSGILVKGQSYQAILEPKLWLSPPLMVGSKVGINYSAEKETVHGVRHDGDMVFSNILTFEGQVYLRWNFLRLGKNPDKTTNIFAQAGLGLIAAYRGNEKPLDNVTQTRGSILADGALGATIPLTERWHIEPSIRGGYPHLYGFSITAGYKIPLPQNTKYKSTTRTEYVETVKTLPPEEIVKRIMISSVEFILFGPDIGKYNVGIDRDARGLNELVLNATAKTLNENPTFRVRIEGHANPITINPSEADELMALSAMRSSQVHDQLIEKGVSEDQMIIVSFGGTRTVTSTYDIANRNRRVELIIIEVDVN